MLSIYYMCVQQVNGVKSNAAREESPPMIYGHDNNIIKYRKKTSPRQLQDFTERGFTQVHSVQ